MNDKIVAFIESLNKKSLDLSIQILLLVILCFVFIGIFLILKLFKVGLVPKTYSRLQKEAVFFLLFLAFLFKFFFKLKNLIFINERSYKIYIINIFYRGKIDVNVF